jgi:ABC-type Fe3+ transport system substrate-binding protein
MKRFPILAAVLVVFAACGGETESNDPGAGTGPAAKLEIISPHWQGIEDEFGAAFEKHWLATTGEKLDVVWRDMGGTSDDLRWIKGEFEKRPDGVGVDVFFGGGLDPYRQLKDLGLLEICGVPPETLAAVPADLGGVPIRDNENTWFGTAMSGFGIIYNKPILGRLGAGAPATWEDLADPKYFSWVGTGDPRHSGTVHMMYEIILQAYGWERGWQVITAMAGNTRQIVQNSGDIPRGVGGGQIAAGTAIDFYAWTQVEEAGEDVVGFVMPDGLTVVNPDSIAVLKGAPNIEAARAFVDFVLSEAGQKLWYLKTGAPGGPESTNLLRMPVRADMYEKFAADSPVKMNPFKQSGGFTYNAELGTLRYSAISDLLGATIVDCHGELVDAWKGAIDSGRADELIGEISKPPVTEKELSALAEGDLTDPIKREQLLAEWVSAARTKYERVGR